MNVAISGRTGRALIIDYDGRLSSLEVGDEQPAPIRGSDLPYFFSDARDLELFRDIDVPQAARELDRAFDFTCALDLTLIAIDPSVAQDIRSDAGADLEPFLHDPAVAARLEGVMYARPVPAQADLAEAARLCQRSVKAHEFFSKLRARQGAIRRVREAWDSIPASSFADHPKDKALFERVAAREGLFRELATSVADGAPVWPFQTAALQNPAINSLNNYRRVLQKWVASLPPDRSELERRLKQYRDERQGEMTRRTGRGRDNARRRIKSVIIGLGFAFGLQVIISLAYTGLAYSAGNSRTALPEKTISIIVLGVTLGAFLIGGFVVGWTKERLPVVNAVIVALLTLIITAVVYLALPEGHKAQFVTAAWLTDQTGVVTVTVPTLLFVAVTVIAAVIGAYLGWRTALPSEGSLANIAVFVGLMGIVFGPIILLAVGRDPTNLSNPGLPLSLLAIVFAVLLVVVGVGFWLSIREVRQDSTYEENTSSSPETHRQAY
jgi:hypothetical protein